MTTLFTLPRKRCSDRQMMMNPVHPIAEWPGGASVKHSLYSRMNFLGVLEEIKVMVVLP